MCLYVLFHSATSLSPVFLERGIFMCLYRIDNVEPPLGLLWVMRCDFPLNKIHVSVRVHSTNRTNRSNRQRWTAGSVVSNEMRFSDRQHQGYGSCPFDRLYSQLTANEMQFSDRQRIESSLFQWNLLDSIGHEWREGGEGRGGEGGDGLAFHPGGCRNTPSCFVLRK